MLEQILATKREELDTLTLPEPLPEPKRRPFAAALRRPRRALGLIAEVKKRLRLKASSARTLIRSPLPKRMSARGLMRSVC